MSSSVVDLAANVATGGVYGIGKAGVGLATGGSLKSALPAIGGLGPGGVAAQTAIGAATATPGGPPQAGAGPTPPSLSDAAKQAALDEQKRQQATGPSDITNIGGAIGILTDPAAKYQKSQLLGGA